MNNTKFSIFGVMLMKEVKDLKKDIWTCQKEFFGTNTPEKFRKNSSVKKDQDVKRCASELELRLREAEERRLRHDRKEERRERWRETFRQKYGITKNSQDIEEKQKSETPLSAMRRWSSLDLRSMGRSTSVDSSSATQNKKRSPQHRNTLLRKCCTT